MASQPTAAEPPDEPPLPPELVDQPAPEGGAELTLGEHLSEIRRRLTISTLSIVLTTVVALVFAQTILDYLLQPGREAYPEFRPIFTELLGFIGAYIKISLMLGIAGAMPILVYQIYAFGPPGADADGAALDSADCVRGHAGLRLRRGVRVLHRLAAGARLSAQFRRRDRRAAGADQQLHRHADPVRLLDGDRLRDSAVPDGLGALGLVTSKRLLRMWRWAIIGAFLLAALITPSIDPVTQAFVAVPTLGLYGLGILLVRLVEPHALVPAVEADPEADEA